ncbi:MAG: NAD(P)H-dependent oxidoreductase [Bacteroidia bacterium]|nr:NAD(P)H-dependent oxidoreductase [Bacteroidia bacterium]
MNILIVHAHHEPNSFNTALKNKAVEVFTQSGNQVVVSDLYAMNFKAIADKNDFKGRSENSHFKYQAEQVYAKTNNLFADDIQIEMDKLMKADVVIFNFPLWWFSVPAILKGWVDRVFAMGFAYGGGKGVYDTGVFKGKKGMLCITTGGPDTTYLPEGKNGDIQKILFHINHGMLYFTGMDVIPSFISYSVARKTDEERTSELIRYEKYLLSINDITPIQY